MIKRYGIVFLPLPVLVLGGCATLMGPDPETTERLDRIDQRLDRIEEQVDSDNLLDLAADIDDLQSELREMRGDVETAQHQVEGTRERQREIYLDLDRRLQALETGEPGGVAVGQPGVGPGLGEDPEGDMPPRGADDLEEDVDTREAESDGDVREAYDEAFGLLRDGRYDQAESAFRDFLQNHSGSDLAANALYWLGEVHYVTRDFETARETFEQVLEDYPDSDKVPDSMLKIGFSLYEMEEWDEAREVLRSVRDQYEDSSASRLAVNRLNQMDERDR